MSTIAKLHQPSKLLPTMIRSALYSLITLAALVGLCSGLSMAGPHLLDRLDGNWSLDSTGFETVFRGVVIFFLSAIVLILVHLAHRLARAFDLPAKTAAHERPVSDTAGTPWEKDPGFTER